MQMISKSVFNPVNFKPFPDIELSIISYLTAMKRSTPFARQNLPRTHTTRGFNR